MKRYYRNHRELAKPAVLFISRRERFFWKIYSVSNTLHSINLKNHAKPAVVKNTKLKMKRARYFMAQRKIPWAAIIALSLVVLALTLTANGTFSESRHIMSSGRIHTSSGITVTSPAASSSLGVYSNSVCTVPMTTTNWGSVSPGGTVTTTIYVENTGEVSLTLSMQTSNWNPTTANGPITISWNQQESTLAPGQSTAAIITLTASDVTTGITSFSVQISISGTAGAS